MSKLATINAAIESRRLITFYYEGSRRTVEPFLTGIHCKTANDSLSAWFIEGYSDSESSNPWRLYTIDKMSNIRLINETFSGSHLNYNPNDSRMSYIYERV